MNYLKDLIRENKYIEMEEEVENILEENNVSDQAIVYKIVLGKERFKTEEEAREYLKAKYFWDYEITEEDNAFVAVSELEQMVEITDQKFQIGREAVGHIANLIPATIETTTEIFFNEKGEVNLSSKFKTIDLSEGLPHIIEVARVAEGYHPSYGKLKITQDNLESMVTNFKSNVTGVDLAINEDHKKNEAFGWLKDVYLSYDKQTLYGMVQWNSKGTTALSEKEYRYFSPEFRFNYVHPHDTEKKEHGATLLGGALTNYPFLKMEAIVELNNKNDSQGEEPVSKETIELSVHNQTVVDLNAKISKTESELEKAKTQNVELSTKVKDLEAKIEKADKEKVHQKLFDDNKINKAQLVALNEGKDMLEVLNLSEKMNPSAKGSDEKPNDDVVVELSEKEKSIAKNLGLTDEEYVNYNK